MGSTGRRVGLMLVAVTALMLVQSSESMTPFGANYGATTDATHTRVQGEGSHVDLVLDATSGEFSDFHSQTTPLLEIIASELEDPRSYAILKS